MLNLLWKLCSAPGTAGDEKAAAEAAAALLRPLGEVTVSPLGSVICRIPPQREGLPRVMLNAHLDQIGLMVTRISDKGFLHVAPCGGVDRRSLAGARVTVHTAGGAIPGVICAEPPHLSDGSGKTIKADRAVVDVGLSGEEAKRRIALGDRITFLSELVPLLGDRVCSGALDDRSGCAAVIRAAQMLKDCDCAEIVVALTTQEETGSAGAATAAFETAPDYAFVVDVSMGRTPDDREEDCGEMGGGPMIGIAPILNRDLFEKVKKIAQKKEIPWQVEVMGARTGTDADYVAMAGRGVKTSVISIPLRYMHTPNEIISLGDLEQTARLLAEAIGGGVCSN